MLYRVKCSCGEVANAAPGHICPKCKQPFQFPQEGYIQLYRMGSPLGIAGGFGLYINEQPFGYIGNRESIRIPVPYGSYKLHVAVGMSRKCTDMIINITPQTPHAYAKIWMKPGFWANSFVIEPAQPSDMPEME